VFAARIPRTGLAAARKRAGYNQQALAEQVGVTKHTVSQWETGATGINAKRRPLLAHALGISLEELDRLLLPHTPEDEYKQENEPPTVQVLGSGRITVAGQPVFLKLVRIPGSEPAVYVPGLVVASENP
jgi:transcriptional regulator with XRE-family HTH domain